MCRSVTARRRRQCNGAVYKYHTSHYYNTTRRTMMKLALLATLLAGASAFAPAQVGKTATALNGAFDNEIGAASAELGCWDPLGYVADGDKKRFDHLRGVELKHGRIAMLATWGYATTWSGARFPGCEDFPAGHEVRDDSHME